MATLQESITAFAIFLEYFIFSYCAIALVLYSFQWQHSELKGNTQASLPSTKQEPIIVPPPQEHPLLVAAS